VLEYECTNMRAKDICWLCLRGKIPEDPKANLCSVIDISEALALLLL
jgi:hypothetical protein